jgi:peptide/nickel transport system ATP-binding protein
MSEPILSIRNLTVHYIKDKTVVRAVNRLSLDLGYRETLGIVGETGAGKTTTAKSIMRLIPDPPGKIVSGDILYKGKNILKFNKLGLRLMRGRDISMIFQDPMTSLNPVMKVGEQISEVIRIHKKMSRKDADREAIKMLGMVGITSDRFNDYPHQFSGGMKQRVVIAISLACNPKILIADEPTTALDVTIQAQVLEMMNELKKNFDTSMILISHDLGVVAEICNRVAIMYAGNIVEIGNIEDIYENAQHPYTLGLFGSIPDLDSDADRLKPIEGLMPDPANLPTGCPFHPRCPYMKQECTGISPEMIEVSPGHSVKCILAQSKI